MAKRIVLTALEIEAVLAVAGNALADETIADDPDMTEAQKERWVEAYERGMDKLRDMLAKRTTGRLRSSKFNLEENIMTFRNNSDLDFKDISSEVARTYTFPGGEVVTIQGPQQLHVSASGGHRIFAEDGCHYIPAGWIHLKWNVKEGAPHFVA